MTDPSTDYDVLVVGAGFAGAAAATVLGRDGWRVALIDPRREYPAEFKAEKIEPDHADALRRLQLADGLLPYAAPIHSVTEAHEGRVLRVRLIEQYGMRYQDMVARLRAQIPSTVDFRIDRIVEATTAEDIQSATLGSGARLTARLLVFATGTSRQIAELAGMQRHHVRHAHSMCAGFDIARADGAPFAFEALTYWADSLDDAIDYITLFPVPSPAPGGMRVNLFSYHEPRDPWVRALADAPRVTIEKAMPRLTRLVGDWSVISKVEIRPISLFASAPCTDGMVLIGDAGQSVCPATGSGLSKVLTDVEVLCRTHLPAWLATPGMSASKLASYTNDPRKRACDAESLESAEYRRQLSTDRSLRWRVHRATSFARIAIGGMYDRLRPTSR